jgi:hypothetical protein
MRRAYRARRPKKENLPDGKRRLAQTVDESHRYAKSRSASPDGLARCFLENAAA